MHLPDGCARLDYRTCRSQYAKWLVLYCVEIEPVCRLDQVYHVDIYAILSKNELSFSNTVLSAISIESIVLATLVVGRW